MNVLIWPRSDLDTFVPVVAWTLAHEIFFYLMVTLAICFGAAGRLLLWAWLSISAVLALTGIELAFPLDFLLSPYNMAFGLGMLAFLLVQSPQFAPLAARAGLAGVLLFLGLGVTEAWSTGVFGSAGPFSAGAQRALLIGFFLASFLLVAGYARAPIRRMKLIGDASYSLYLVHYPVMVVAVLLASRLLRGAPPYLLFCAVALAGVIAGVIYFYVIERPSLRLFGSKRSV